MKHVQIKQTINHCSKHIGGKSLNQLCDTLRKLIQIYGACAWVIGRREMDNILGDGK